MGKRQAHTTTLENPLLWERDKFTSISLLQSLSNWYLRRGPNKLLHSYSRLLYYLFPLFYSQLGRPGKSSSSVIPKPVTQENKNRMAGFHSPRPIAPLTLRMLSLNPNHQYDKILQALHCPSHKGDEGLLDLPCRPHVGKKIIILVWSHHCWL